MLLEFTPVKEDDDTDSCLVNSRSRSQTKKFIPIDYGTNYCNGYNVLSNIKGWTGERYIYHFKTYPDNEKEHCKTY